MGGGGQRVRQVEPCTFHLLKTNSWGGKRLKVLLKMCSQLVEIEFSPNFSLGRVRQADQVYTRSIRHDGESLNECIFLSSRFPYGGQI